MAVILFMFIILIALLPDTHSTFATEVNLGNPIKCTKGNIYGVRIADCASEPCLIKRGQRYAVEVDFDFQALPTRDIDIDFNAIIPNWNNINPKGSSTIVQGRRCAELGLTCPVQPNKKYTLKTSIYIGPEYKNSYTGQKSGFGHSNWFLTQTAKGPVIYGDYNNCYFSVDLIVLK